MSAISSIEEDLAWREREIAAMRLLLLGSGVTNSQKRALLRAGWAMLYAHYEGFIRNALAIFYDEAAKAIRSCGHLPSVTKPFALRDALNSLKNLPHEGMLSGIENFHREHLAGAPVFPDVDAKANLWPDILIGLLETADLKTDVVQKHKSKLRTLVSRRNSIAHGERNFIDDLTYFIGYEEAVYEVLYDVALQVDSRLSEPPYFAQQDAEQDALLSAC